MRDSDSDSDDIDGVGYAESDIVVGVKERRKECERERGIELVWESVREKHRVKNIQEGNAKTAIK